MPGQSRKEGYKKGDDPMFGDERAYDVVAYAVSRTCYLCSRRVQSGNAGRFQVSTQILFIPALNALGRLIPDDIRFKFISSTWTGKSEHALASHCRSLCTMLFAWAKEQY